MSEEVINILHKTLVKEEPKSYPSETIDYTPELYYEIMDNFADYYMTGWTVCGAQDPAVVYLGDSFAKKHPELAKYTVVRVIDKFLNEWSSATLLEFSNKDITDEEYQLYDEIMKEEE